jgi:hypothetical protein
MDGVVWRNILVGTKPGIQRVPGAPGNIEI